MLSRLTLKHTSQNALMVEIAYISKAALLCVIFRCIFSDLCSSSNSHTHTHTHTHTHARTQSWAYLQSILKWMTKPGLINLVLWTKIWMVISSCALNTLPRFSWLYHVIMWTEVRRWSTHLQPLLYQVLVYFILLSYCSLKSTQPLYLYFSLKDRGQCFICFILLSSWCLKPSQQLYLYFSIKDHGNRIDEVESPANVYRLTQHVNRRSYHCLLGKSL